MGWRCKAARNISSVSIPMKISPSHHQNLDLSIIVVKLASNHINPSTRTSLEYVEMKLTATTPMRNKKYLEIPPPWNIDTGYTGKPFSGKDLRLMRLGKDSVLRLPGTFEAGGVDNGVSILVGVMKDVEA